MKSVSLTGLVAVAGLLCGSCTPDFVKQDESDVILRIIDINGDPGGDDQQAGDILFSDVCCAVFNDDAVLTFQAIPKNASLNTIDLHNDVMLERYEVLFFRSDGRNTEGVDVPYRITGPVAALVPASTNATTQVVVNVVRHQAKIEPPLRNLHGVFLQGLPSSGVFQFGGAGILTTIAEITIHGRQTNGKAVQAVARLQVVFADFGGEG
jgi:hypothetical protein